MVMTCPLIERALVPPSKFSLLTVVADPLLRPNPLGNVTTILPLAGMGLTVMKETVTFSTLSCISDAGSTFVEVSVAGFTVYC